MIQSRPLRTLQDQALNELGTQIVAGRWAPGEPLQIEDDLAAEMQVSRGVLREAVKALVAKGLLVVRPKTGTRVLPRSEWNMLDADVLHWQLEQGRDELVQNLTEARGVIEPGVAGLAAVRATQEDLDGLREAFRLMEATAGHNERQAFNDADVAFHLALVSACHNPILASLERAIALALHLGFETTSQAPGGLRHTVPLHRSLLQAVSRSDPAAARRAAQRLIDASYQDLETVLGQPVLGRPNVP